MNQGFSMSVSPPPPIRAELVPRPGAHLRLSAPSRQSVAVVIDGGPEIALAPESGGYFSGLVEGVGAGARYKYRLDADDSLYPDLASRFQPDGPHGWSQVIDPAAFRWTDRNWKGVPET